MLHRLSNDIVSHFQFFVNYFLTIPKAGNIKIGGGILETTNLNAPKTGKHDVFRSFLVKNATYDGEYEIPKIHTSNLIPEQVISFSKAKNGKQYDAFVHFYKDDEKIECFWNNPQKYLPILKKFYLILLNKFQKKELIVIVHKH